MNKNVNNFYLS